MKSITRFFIFMGVLVLLGASCSNIQPDNQMEAVDGVRFTAKIRSEVNTKAVSDGETSIIVEWKAGEKIALIYKVEDKSYNTTATVTAVDGSNNATISATLKEGVQNDTEVTLIYPASAADGTTGNILSSVLSEQDGALSAARDVRKGKGKLSVNEGSASFSDSPSLQAEYAICKFTIQDLEGSALNVSSFTVRNGYNDIITTVTPSAPTGTLYVSLPKRSGNATWIIATADNHSYVAFGNSTLNAGKFYTPTTNMATVGNVIAADHRFYIDSTAAANAGNTSMAMIAYIGTVDEVCRHGLAISLSDAYDYRTDFEGAKFGVDQMNFDKNLNGFYWHLPTVTDWQYMVSGNNTAIYFADISSIQTALSHAQGSPLAEDYHWTSTEDGDDAYLFYYTGSDASVSVKAKKNEFYAHVRPCLAF